MSEAQHTKMNMNDIKHPITFCTFRSPPLCTSQLTNIAVDPLFTTICYVFESQHSASTRCV
jgi:hypothetical protein